MLKKFIPFLLLVVIAFTLVKCGQRGAPTGGPKDVISPEVKTSSPLNNATNFNGRKITLQFDEYVTVSGFYNEFVISPPVKKQPDFKVKGKKLILDFDSAFAENTTYSLFLGKAVKDLNGGNVLANNQLVFSTGKFVDSLTFAGEVFDAKTMRPFDKGMVQLYKNTYDSVQSKEIPSYFAQITDGKFQFTNLAGGEYKIFALVDINGNYLYDLPNEEVAFSNKTISISEKQDSSKFKLIAFQPEKSEQFIDHFSSKYRGEVQVKFNNPVQNFQIEVLGSSFKKDWNVINWNEKKDSLSIWSTELSDLDSFNLVLNFNGMKDTLNFNMGNRIFAKDQPITLTHNMNNLSNSFKDNLSLIFNKPISSYDASLFVLKKSDSITVSTNVRQELNLTAFSLTNQLSPAEEYEMEVLPGAVRSIFGDSNTDTLHFHFNTAAAEALSDLVFKYDFSEIKSEGILQFYSGKNIVSTYYISEPVGRLNLPGLLPAKYKFKFIADEDGNKRWSPGNYWEKKQPEKVYWYKDEVMVRANWEMEIEWNLIPTSE